MTFDDWMIAVNFWTRRFAGVDVADLPDCCFHDWFDDGVRPRTAARRAVNSAKE